MARVVIAPDSLKGTATAAVAAAAIARGWRRERPDDELAVRPQADGGEGTLDAIAAADPAARVTRARVTGPDGRPVDARILLRADGEAVVEIAETSGLPLMPTLDAGAATTRGLGELLRAALAAGARSITIGLGGSATTDGACGALAALGLRLLDARGVPLRDGGAALVDLATIDARELTPPPPGGVRILTDVTSPLLGPAGAARVFGPQKGADAETVALLDRGLGRFADLVGGDPGAPGAGAAGGAGFGFATLWGARLVPGAAAIAELSGLDAAVEGADVVITAEGRVDATSWRGKVVGRLLGAAPESVTPIVIGGSIAERPRTPRGDPVLPIALDDLAPDAASARADVEHWLVEAGARAAREWASSRDAASG